jgi:hypothetical protein
MSDLWRCSQRNSPGTQEENQGVDEMKVKHVSDKELHAAIDNLESSLSSDERSRYDAKNEQIKTHFDTLITAAALMVNTAEALPKICACSQCQERFIGLTLGANAILTEVILATRRPTNELGEEVKLRATMLKAPVTL